ncbi:FAD:protein FMN transferase [Mangrovitalea sediminis]|uniref:FAD:protein FMN transferase n=1 Tax=Mangrovitalea sediminis TaxID=1982043 RepID=UPI000BE4B656|nr:FAD:protein FMN transferase [Mangrovitalea sediminis]
MTAPCSRTLPSLDWQDGYWVGRFQAMASPCEILMDGVDEPVARTLTDIAAKEAWRIEQKFSRYVAGNIIDRINRGGGQPVAVDEETARLLDYAEQCFSLSDGRFDVTSGILRQAWRFDGSDRLPEAEAVARLLPRIGWQRVEWRAPWLQMPEGMELDLGGVGKEYAVDRTLILLQQAIGETGAPYSLLVNFGGDLVCSGPRPDGSGWRIGIENARAIAQAADAIVLKQGALATSGDSRRFLLRDGVRYGHILDPRTGWPVPNAPYSVSVAQPTCTLAGMLATFAMLQGDEAETFLASQGGRYWVQRA